MREFTQDNIRSLPDQFFCELHTQRFSLMGSACNVITDDGGAVDPPDQSPEGHGISRDARMRCDRQTAAAVQASAERAFRFDLQVRLCVVQRRQHGQGIRIIFARFDPDRPLARRWQHDICFEILIYALFESQADETGGRQYYCIDPAFLQPA